MCFNTMSKTAKSLTASTVGLANQMAKQAGTIFGAADKTFNTISNAMTSIVNGGPSQFGFSNGQFTAMNAAAVNAGATEQRNLKAQAAVTGQPFNAAAINQDVANKTATAENQIVQEGYQQGNQNFFKAASDLQAAPGVYGAADKANTSAMSALGEASTAQANRDASAGTLKNLAKTGVAIAGDIGGSFIGDPNLGNQITSPGAPSSQAGMGSAATKLFGQGGSVYSGGGASPSAPDVNSVVDPTGGYSSSSVLSMFGPNMGTDMPSFGGGGQ